MRKIDRIVIHCSATEENDIYTVEDITEWHLKRGFKTIGYHYVVYLDGTVHAGRPIGQVGAHARGFNKSSVGICYIGGLRKGKPFDTRNIGQLYALRNLVAVLKSIYPIKDVCGHRDLSVDLNGDGVIEPSEWLKACPCFDVKTEL